MDSTPPNRPRRGLLAASIIAGVLTAGGTLAGNLVNLLTGPTATTLAVTGAVLAGAAAVVAIVSTGPNRSPEGAEDEEPGHRSAPRPAPREDTQPLAVLRSVRLPLGCLLVLLGPLLIAGFDIEGNAIDTAEPLAIPLGLLAYALAVVAALGVHYFVHVRDLNGRARQRGTGMDAVVVYTAAAGLGLWQAELTGPGLGLLVAGLVLIGATAVAGLVEDDVHRHGPAPLLLVTVAVAIAVAVVQMATGGWAAAGPVGVLAAIAVVLPAGLRGRFYDWPGGLTETVSLLVGILAALAAGPEWAVAGAAVFIASLIYTRQYPQDRVSVLYAKGRLGKMPPWLVAGVAISAWVAGAVGGSVLLGYVLRT